MSANREKRGRFSAEVRDRAIRLVQEQTPQYSSQWAAITAIAPKLECTKETLWRWVREAERDAGLHPGLTRADTDRIYALEKCASCAVRRDPSEGVGFFAAAELDRHTR